LSFASRVKDLARNVSAAALEGLRRMLTTEPVRVRSAVVAACGALAVFLPALANSNTSGQVAGVVMVILPLLLGESARSKVSPSGV
jgi:hypothetical protein